MNSEKMTKYNMEELECPKCGHKHLRRKYSLINVTEKPDMKEEILKNKIFYFTCDNCKLTAPLTYDSFYLDSKKKLCIALVPSMTEEQKIQMEKWEKEKGFTKRMVDNINDLKEKIMIAENHLDDRVIELIKIQYIGQMKKEMSDDTLMNILFDYNKQNNEFCFLVFFEKKGVGKVPLTMDFYHSIEMRYLDQIKSHSTDAFMKVDMEWAGSLMLRRN